MKIELTSQHEQFDIIFRSGYLQSLECRDKKDGMSLFLNITHPSRQSPGRQKTNDQIVQQEVFNVEVGSFFWSYTKGNSEVVWRWKFIEMTRGKSPGLTLDRTFFEVKVRVVWLSFVKKEGETMTWDKGSPENKLNEGD